MHGEQGIFCEFYLQYVLFILGVQMRPVGSPSSSDLILMQAKEAQIDFNLLMHKVAHDHDFLYASLKK